MDVRYTDRPETIGSSSRFNPLSPGDVMVTLSNGETASKFPSALEVRLSDGTWKGMAAALHDGDVVTDEYETIFGDPPAKQVAIPELSVAASLGDVWRAAADKLGAVGSHGWCTGLDHTDTGVVLRGRWAEPGAWLLWSWTATYEVGEVQPGGSTLSGTLTVTPAELGVPFVTPLDAVADRWSRNLAGTAQRIARECSADLERSPAGRSALSQPASGSPARERQAGHRGPEGRGLER